MLFVVDDTELTGCYAVNRLLCMYQIGAVARRLQGGRQELRCMTNLQCYRQRRQLSVDAVEVVDGEILLICC